MGNRKTPKDAFRTERQAEAELLAARQRAREAERAATLAQKRYDTARRQSDEVILGEKGA